MRTPGGRPFPHNHRKRRPAEIAGAAPILLAFLLDRADTACFATRRQITLLVCSLFRVLPADAVGGAETQRVVDLIEEALACRCGSAIACEARAAIGTIRSAIETRGDSEALDRVAALEEEAL